MLQEVQFRAEQRRQVEKHGLSIFKTSKSKLIIVTNFTHFNHLFSLHFSQAAKDDLKSSQDYNRFEIVTYLGGKLQKSRRRDQETFHGKDRRLPKKVEQSTEDVKQSSSSSIPGSFLIEKKIKFQPNTQLPKNRLPMPIYNQPQTSVASEQSQNMFTHTSLSTSQSFATDKSLVAFKLKKKQRVKNKG